MMKISHQRLVVESFKLQDHRQQSCVMRNVTVESVGSSDSGNRADERRQQRAVVTDTGMHCTERSGTTVKYTQQWAQRVTAR